MAGRILDTDGNLRSFEISHTFTEERFGVRTSARQVVACFSPQCVTLLSYPANSEMVHFPLSFEDVQTLYTVMQEYQQFLLAGDGLAESEDFPF